MTRYHLTRKDREITDEKEIREILSSGRLITVALCRGNDPYLVTMNYGYDGERNALYFHCALQGQKLDFIRENPRVCATLIVDRGYVEGKCEHKYRSLIIRGRMSVEKDLAGKKNGLKILLEHQEKDPRPVWERNLAEDEGYDIVEVLRIDIEEISGKQSL